MSDLTTKQEKFAQAVASGESQADAYRRAYNVRKGTKPETVWEQSSRLMADHKVAARVAELRAIAADKATLSRAWVLKMLMENAEKGQATGDLTAANKALELLGKTEELQMFIERKHVESDNRHHHSASDVSAFDEFLAGVAGGASEGASEDALPN